MLNRLNSFIHFFDIGDLRFFLLIGKKNFKNLAILTILVSILVYLFSLNLEKKYESEATIVIAPDENKIVNIEEVYSIDSQTNRVNNQIAILRSDEVLEFVAYWDEHRHNLPYEIDGVVIKVNSLFQQDELSRFSLWSISSATLVPTEGYEFTITAPGNGSDYNFEDLSKN